ncbi:MAG: KOW domain-containing RNA-binding protein [Clostridia bacterium]|nr:KOW domain-containing RNA-binding protein [Clostridia bacterium]
MEIQFGRVVYSKAGRDQGEYLAVVGQEGNFLLLVNGKDRPLERPKKKNVKHVGLTNTVLDNGSMSTNRSLRRTLKSFSDVAHENGI